VRAFLESIHTPLVLIVARIVNGMQLLHEHTCRIGK